ncbi:MAG: hypothetical protein MUE33_11485 [Cytophagaceae bacterium]|jgi:hypothetical protein|nr:hypothetical protein [Cytophagaceae bacterium]
MSPTKYPRRLSSGANNTVIALSETEVAKLFLEDTRSDIGSEAENPHSIFMEYYYICYDKKMYKFSLYF